MKAKNKMDIKKLVEEKEARLEKLQGDWRQLLEIGKLDPKQARKLMRSKKECSELGLAISVGKNF